MVQGQLDKDSTSNWNKRKGAKLIDLIPKITWLLWLRRTNCGNTCGFLWFCGLQYLGQSFGFNQSK